MDKAISLAKDLVAIRSESGNEKEIGEFIFRHLREIGAKPEKQFFEDGRFNILCFGSGPLIINGHMDTVPVGTGWTRNPFGEIADGCLYGRGSCDTKGNVACLLAAMEDAPGDDITFVFNCQEENNFDGINKVLELRGTRLSHIRYSISLEPTGGMMFHCNKGQYIFKISAKGRSTHAARPHLGENAIRKLGPVIARLNEYEESLKSRKHRYLNHPTINMGQIHGGTAPNVVPADAFIVVDRRVIPGETGVVEEMKSVAAPLDVQLINRIEPAETPDESPIIEYVSSAAKRNGITAQVNGLVATAELSAYRQHGIEGVIFGTATFGQAHTADEHCRLEDLEIGRKVFGDIIRNAAELEPVLAENRSKTI